MGDVTVPGITEEDLRRAAMAAAKAKAEEKGVRRYPDRKAGQFTRKDWQADEAREGRVVGEATVMRDLDKLVKLGILATEKRRDPRIGKAVWVYWYVE